jgi:CubicO group peptidase (beta-lactamase class C family)
MPFTSRCGKRRAGALVVSLAAALGIAACGTAPPEPYVYAVPPSTGDGWQTASAESAGIDPAQLEAAADAIGNGEFRGVDSMLVVRGGVLVHETYFNKFDREKLHDLRSATKSITSALVGIAIDQGLLRLDEPVLPRLGGEAGVQNFDARKRSITVESLLTMTPGLACDDWNLSSPGNERKMYDQRDWVKFILDLPMVADPGTRYGYCTGGVVVLGAVLGQAGGMRADAYARQVLFDPLGIVRAEWQFTPTGAVDTGGHIHMRPRDMAKFGQLFLQRGLWNGRRILSEAYVERSTSFRVRTISNEEYGYLWWERTTSRGGTPVRTYYALGNGGQQIIVAPEVDTVAVFTGSNFDTSATATYPQALFDRYVLGAIR